MDKIVSKNKGTILVVIMLMIASLLHGPVVLALWEYSFDDGTYSHAFLIPFISIYLIKHFFDEGKIQFRDNNFIVFFGLLLISSYLVFIMFSAQISFGIWISYLIMLNMVALTLVKCNRYVLFAISYLIFLLPVWGVLVTPLQNLSVKAVTIMMGFTTVPVFVENQFVQIPSGTFEIAGGCSGLRYFITSIAIGSLFAALYINKLKNVCIFLSIAIIGALVTNWIRISLLIIIGHETEMTSDLMEDHNNFGWYIFLPFMFLLFHIGNKLSTPENHKISTTTIKTTSPLKLLLMVTSLMVFSTSIHHTTIENLTIKNTIPHGHLKPTIHDFHNVDVIKSTKGLNYLIFNFDGNKLSNSPTYYDNKLVPNGWQVTDSKINKNWQIRQIKNRTDNAVLLTSYEIDNKFFATKSAFKIQRIKSGLLGHNHTKLHWQLIPCKINCNAKIAAIVNNETIGN